MFDHIKEVGPHTHDWRDVFTAGATKLQECSICCTRRALDWQGALLTEPPAWLKAA